MDLIYLSCEKHHLDSQQPLCDTIASTAKSIANGQLPANYGAVRKVVAQLWQEHDPPIVTLEDEQGAVWKKFLKAAPPEVVK